MKALVVGGSRFIGFNTADALIESKNDIRVYDVLRERFRETPSVVDVRIAENGSASVFDQALYGVNIVEHAASATMLGSAKWNPKLDASANTVPFNLTKSLTEGGIRKSKCL